MLRVTDTRLPIVNIIITQLHITFILRQPIKPLVRRGECLQYAVVALDSPPLGVKDGREMAPHCPRRRTSLATFCPLTSGCGSVRDRQFNLHMNADHATGEVIVSQHLRLQTLR